MKKLLIVALAATSSAAAQATLLTYEYAATVTELYEYHYYGLIPHAPLDHAQALNGTISIGDSFTGRFSVDPQQSRAIQYTGGNFYWAVYPGAGAASVVFPRGVTFSSDTDNAVEVSGDNALAIRNYDYYGSGQSVSIDFSSKNGVKLERGTLLDAPSFIAGAKGVVSYRYRPDWYSPTGVLAKGELTSFRLVSVVPEPHTYAMFAAGLGLLAWRRKRA